MASTLKVDSILPQNPSIPVDIAGTYPPTANGVELLLAFPRTTTGTTQTSVKITAGTGAPSNADGSNGWIYIRGDGGAGTTIYHKRAGTWVGII